MVSMGLPIRKLLMDITSLLLRAKKGENKKPPAKQRSVFLPVALPDACEVS
jgi:hypothetical protein